MLTAAYYMLRDGVEYRDLGPDHFERRDKSKAINRLVRRLYDLGCEVELKHAALEGGRITRGANQTCVDALLVARTAAGRRAYLLEWKYCERYPNPKDKSAGRSGSTRKARYQHLYAAPTSSFNGALPFEELLFEPFTS